MSKYAAKATVWLLIESDYADGVGEAENEVEYIVESLCGANGVSLARVTDIELLEPILREEPGISVNQLFFGEVCLDDGMR